MQLFEIGYQDGWKNFVRYFDTDLDKSCVKEIDNRTEYFEPDPHGVGLRLAARPHGRPAPVDELVHVLLERLRQGHPVQREHPCSCASWSRPA